MTTNYRERIQDELAAFEKALVMWDLDELPVIENGLKQTTMSIEHRQYLVERIEYLKRELELPTLEEILDDH